jgi:hypothetical protein
MVAHSEIWRKTMKPAGPEQLAALQKASDDERLPAELRARAARKLELWRQVEAKSRQSSSRK